MNKQEVISKLKLAIPKNNIDDYQRGEAAGLNFALLLLAELDEPEKPVVPQFVADWYDDNQDDFEFNLYRLCVDYDNCELDKEMMIWFSDKNNNPIQTITAMHQLGYEVKKEKLYTVEIPIANSPLGYHYVLRKTTSGEIIIDSFFTNNWGNYDYCQLTESEIKKDHEWAWKYVKEVKND